MDRVDRKIQSYLYQITFLSLPLPVYSPLPLPSRVCFRFDSPRRYKLSMCELNAI